jgi:hypothetical protein
MKIVLACLMCLVLGASECFAIDGGPFDGGGAIVNVTGIYAGVFVPIPIIVAPGPPPVILNDNSLALFTFTVPRTGLATGTSAVFRNGFFYSGTILGSADPDSAKLTGIVASFFEEAIQEGTTTIKKHYDANGQFVNAKVTANQNAGARSAARIRGKASLTYRLGANADDPNGDSGGPILYKIKGFKQAEISG